MRTVDTNVLVRLITGDNAGQAVSADSFIQKGAWVSILVLAEATWVLPRYTACAPALWLRLSRCSPDSPGFRRCRRGIDPVPLRARARFLRLPNFATGPQGWTSSAGYV